MRLRAALTILVAICFPLTARTGQEATGGEVNHGTINVVLANQNGIVVLTDSMITAGDHQLPDPAKKLFKLDDHTVCTIAGFIAAPGPLPDFYTSSAAIIEEYADQLKVNPASGIGEKLTSLGFLFTLDLSTIAGLRASTGSQAPTENYKFVLTIAGYDKDGIPKIGRIVLETPPKGGFSDSAIQQRSITTVAKQLVWKLAGQPEIAEGLLKYPTSADDDAIKIYAESMQENEGESLTVEQMTQLASKLAWHTAQVYRSVGGPDQIAVLNGGHVVRIEQPVFPKPGKAPFQFMVVEDSFFGGATHLLSSRSKQLFLRNTFNRGQVQLDGQYFFANSFLTTDLVYDGGPLYFDKSNHVAECRLVLGQHAKRDDERVQHLIHDFQWKQVGRYVTN